MSEQLKEPVLINTGDIDNPTPVSEAILNGYAPGNELYNYSSYPEMSFEELKGLRGANYQTVFYEVTKKLLGSAIPDDVLRATSEDVYSSGNFDFDEGNLRFTTLPSGVHVVGLSDGPTGAFKDMAMQPLARWMSYLQGAKGRELLTILLSTSGDTGPAALEAFGGLPNIEIVNMMPKEGVYPFQWAQMAKAADKPGVHVLELAGAFSDINDLQMQADLAYDLGSVNSVNIARIIAQVPYHVASYLKAIELEGKEIGDPVDISIPSGNFGNALSAIIARKMGVPFRNIIVATNENNTLDTLLSEGNFKLSEFQHTDSSAQDIRMPSNIWRYFSMLYGNDPEKVSHTYDTLMSAGSVAIKDVGVEDESLLEGVTSSTIRKDQRAQVVKDVYVSSNGQIMIESHTANAVAAVEELRANDPDVPMIVPETAKPFKFDDYMMRTIGQKPPRPDRFVGLEESQRGKELAQVANLEDLLAYLKEHTGARPRN